jgi:carboxypeptidase PM20D1
MSRYVSIILTGHFFYFSTFTALIAAEDTIPQSAQLLSRYIMHASVTGYERSAGLFFSTVARQKGFHVKILTDETGSFNFTASLYPLEMNKPNIILLNHIDVVPATDELAHEQIHAPFSGAIDDGMVWGRGAIDNKGMGVMQLLGMEYFLELASTIDLPFNVTMLSVSGEETGGYLGAAIVVDEFIELLNPVVVYGEGGAGIPGILRRDPDRKLFGISIAFKRSLWLELRLINVTSGHGAVPPPDYVVKEKIQALNRLLDRSERVRFSGITRKMFNELGKIEGGVRGLALRNIWLFRPFVIRSLRQEEVIFSLITNTATITSINSPPGAANQIPQEIVAVLDCRLLPETDTEDFIADLRRIFSNDAISINIIHERERTDSSETGEYFDFMKEALRAVYEGAGVIPVLAPASNDNNYFRALGIPAYGILPVYIPVYLLETIHNVNERIPVDALENGVAVYRELIRIIMASHDLYSGAELKEIL